MRLNLGANDRKVHGFLSVDIAPPADFICDLAGPWPWPDSSVEEVLAYSVFEHIGDCTHFHPWACELCAGPRSLLPDRFRAQRGKIHVMNELWRVLRPGGIARLQLPHATKGDGGHCDPTHCSYWTQSDFEYYSPGVPERDRFRDSSYYAIRADFQVKNLDKNGHIPMKQYRRLYGGEVWEMIVVLEAVKP